MTSRRAAMFGLLVWENLALVLLHAVHHVQLSHRLSWPFYCKAAPSKAAVSAHQLRWLQSLHRYDPRHSVLGKGMLHKSKISEFLTARLVILPSVGNSTLAHKSLPQSCRQRERVGRVSQRRQQSGSQWGLIDPANRFTRQRVKLFQ